MTKLIHQTDIFHPHCDPDDHWDLATVFALAKCNALELAGIVCDNPATSGHGDPAVIAATQLAYITGIVGTPFVIGSKHKLRDKKDDQSDRDPKDSAAARWLCKTLEQTNEKIAITSVGSSVDIALAGVMRPDLFRNKVKALYLNSGSACPGEKNQKEYNVERNPAAYASLFDLECPIYWCPCLHTAGILEQGEFGAWYPFKQGDILVQISKALRNYFYYMLDQMKDPLYLRYLDTDIALDNVLHFWEATRHMFSTASIFHAGGMIADIDKGLVKISESENPVFEFLPIDVSCDDDGATTWSRTDKDTNRYLFRMRDKALYPKVMSSALAQLLVSI